MGGGGWRQDTNETLFYRVLVDNVTGLMPIVYTPVVGEACTNYGTIFQRPRGLYLSIRDAGNIARVVANWPEEDVAVAVRSAPVASFTTPPCLPRNSFPVGATRRCTLEGHPLRRQSCHDGTYRGTSLIRNRPTLAPYSRCMSGALWWS